MDLRICQAIADRRLLMFAYRGALRVVEPHLYGRTTAQREGLSAWMRPGWSRVDPEGGWRMFSGDALESLEILPETFDGPRPNFNPEDPHFIEVFCRLSAPGGPEGDGSSSEQHTAGPDASLTMSEGSPEEAPPGV